MIINSTRAALWGGCTLIFSNTKSMSHNTTMQNFSLKRYRDLFLTTFKIDAVYINNMFNEFRLHFTSKLLCEAERGWNPCKELSDTNGRPAGLGPGAGWPLGSPSARWRRVAETLTSGYRLTQVFTKPTSSPLHPNLATECQTSDHLIFSYPTFENHTAD